MLKKGQSTNKEHLYYLLSVCLNIYLAVAAVMFVLYVVAPLLGGKFFPRAVIVYASWIVMAVYAKTLLKKSQQGHVIVLREHLLLCMYTIACVFLWFPYRISILFTVLAVVGTAFSHNAQKNRDKSSENSRVP